MTLVKHGGLNSRMFILGPSLDPTKVTGKRTYKSIIHTKTQRPKEATAGRSADNYLEGRVAKPAPDETQVLTAGT